MKRPRSWAIVFKDPSLLVGLLSQHTEAIWKVLTFKASLRGFKNCFVENYQLLFCLGFPWSFFESIFLSYSALSKVLSSLESWWLVHIWLVHHRHWHGRCDHLRHVAEGHGQIFKSVLTQKCFKGRTYHIFHLFSHMFLDFGGIIWGHRTRSLTGITNSTNLVSFLSITREANFTVKVSERPCLVFLLIGFDLLLKGKLGLFFYLTFHHLFLCQ